MKKLFFILFVFIIFGCDSKKETFKYAGLKVYDPVYVANEKGFFEDENLDFELVDVVTGGSTVIQMVSGGFIDAGLVSTMALINAKNNGVNVIGVADIQSSFYNYPLEEFYVRNDSKINNVCDLKGKKIAINLVKSSFHYTWDIVLENNGLSEKEVSFITLPFDQQEKALEKGIVDAIGLMSPYSSKARKNNKLKKLFDATDVFGEKQFCMIFVNSEKAIKNKENVIKFVSAINKSIDWIENNQEEAKKIISKYTNIPVEYIDDYKFQDNGRIVEEDIKYWLEYMHHKEKVSKELKIEDIGTNKYNLKEVKNK